MTTIYNVRTLRFASLLSGVLLLSATGMAQERSRTEMTTTSEMTSLMERIESRADAFEDKLEMALDKSDVNGSGLEDTLNRLADQMEDAVDDMAENYKEKDNREFIDNMENGLIAAAGINRFMLRKDMSGASAEWNQLREDLNSVAGQYHRPPLPNMTVGTLVAVSADLLEKPDITLVMERLESYTDRFEEKFESAIQHSTANLTDREDVYDLWADNLEDTSDDMLEEFKEKDYKEFATKLEHTLVAAEVMNRIMVRSDLFKDAELQWKAVRDDLNKVAVVFGHPVISAPATIATSASR